MTGDIYDEHTCTTRMHLETAAAVLRTLKAAASSEVDDLEPGDVRLLADQVLEHIQRASTATESMDRQVQRWRDGGRLLPVRPEAA